MPAHAPSLFSAKSAIYAAHLPRWRQEDAGEDALHDLPHARSTDQTGRMTASAGTPAAPSFAIDLPRLEEPASRWRTLLIHGITAALAIAIALSISEAELGLFVRQALATPSFVVTLLALYFTLPVADWIIFRRLWRLPAAGFPVLLRKRITNELLVSYSGELYFYLWARQRTGLTNAPFGAIKDVNIQSALAANVVTLALMLVAYPFLTELHMGDYAGGAFWSAALIFAISAGFVAFRRRVFSLGARDLWTIFGIHMVRLTVTTFLGALLWHLVMPSAPIGLWLGLSALRLLVYRLPLLPAKEVLFATITLFLLGDDAASGVVALTSASVLILHLFVGMVLILGGLIPERRAR